MISHAMATGIFTAIIAHFLPIGSVIRPENTLPSGWQINDMLAKWDNEFETKSEYNRNTHQSKRIRSMSNESFRLD